MYSILEMINIIKIILLLNKTYQIKLTEYCVWVILKIILSYKYSTNSSF